jgi:hypothetical protein
MSTKSRGYTVRLGTFVGERPTLNAEHPTPNSYVDSVVQHSVFDVCCGNAEPTGPVPYPHYQTDSLAPLISLNDLTILRRDHRSDPR